MVHEIFELVKYRRIKLTKPTLQVIVRPSLIIFQVGKSPHETFGTVNDTQWFFRVEIIFALIKYCAVVSKI